MGSEEPRGGWGWAGRKKQRGTARVQGSREQSRSQKRCQRTVGSQATQPPEDQRVPSSAPLHFSSLPRGLQHHPPRTHQNHWTVNSRCVQGSAGEPDGTGSAGHSSAGVQRG